MPILAINAKQLSARHGDGTEAYFNVNLVIHDNECIGLVGPNGAGKTSFLLSCTGILPCYTGSLTVFDINPFEKTSRQQLPRQLGLVMQQSDDQIFNPSVFEDIAFGPLNIGVPAVEVRERVKSALEQVQMHGYEERVPHRLSGGEKRRVALAGILAMQPAMLLLDEPTQDLDPRGRRQLMQILGTLPQGKIIASHDLDFILATCSRTIVFDRTVVADGATTEVLANSELMENHGLEVPLRLLLNR